MPAEPVKSVNGTDAKLFRDGPIPVYILPSGKFAAYHQNRWVIKPSVRQLEGALTRIPPVVEVMGIEVQSRLKMVTVSTHRLTAFEGYHKYRDESGKMRMGPYEADMYILSAVIIDKIRELESRREAAEDAFRDELRTIMKDARRVNRSNLAEVQAGSKVPTEGEREKLTEYDPDDYGTASHP
jgi:hypothetical protein